MAHPKGTEHESMLNGSYIYWNYLKMRSDTVNVSFVSQMMCSYYLLSLPVWTLFALDFRRYHLWNEIFTCSLNFNEWLKSHMRDNFFSSGPIHSLRLKFASFLVIFTLSSSETPLKEWNNQGQLGMQRAVFFTLLHLESVSFVCTYICIYKMIKTIEQFRKNKGTVCL